MRNIKEVRVPVEGYGRDKGKLFLIREVDAYQAETWAARAIEAMAKSGAAIPDGLDDSGLAGLFTLGIRAFLGAPSALVLPLLEEMFLACVSIVPDPANRKVLRGAGVPGVDPVGPLIADDTEEVKTRLLLRNAIVELHTGFSVAAFLSQKWAEAEAAAAILKRTETSREPSAPLSQVG